MGFVTQMFVTATVDWFFRVNLRHRFEFRVFRACDTGRKGKIGKMRFATCVAKVKYDKVAVATHVAKAKQAKFGLRLVSQV